MALSSVDSTGILQPVIDSLIGSIQDASFTFRNGGRNYSQWFSCPTDLVTVNVAALYRCNVYTCSCAKHHYVCCCQIAAVINLCWVCNDLVLLAC